MTTELLRLAELCEQARGPDRLLDANIHWRIRRGDFEADTAHKSASYCYARSGWTLNKADRLYLNSIPVPTYTASLDAAMTLVPDGWTGIIPVSGGDEAWLWERNGSPKGHRCNAATPALALCAASLRARSQGNDNA